MGRPYEEELGLLHETYQWASNADIEELVSPLSACIGLPLVAVGSGGSLSVANFASLLHQTTVQQVAKSMTPLELATFAGVSKESLTLFLTARGQNPDIIGTLKRVIAADPTRCLVVCFQRDSPIAQVARENGHVDVAEFDSPVGKDGFLATNSLLAFCVLLYRAYQAIFPVLDTLPKSFHDLLGAKSREDLRALLCDEALSRIWERETLIVLHGPTTQPAAIDLESKFTEAALRNVQIADYRNFAHGRHHWLAKRLDKSAVLAFVSDDDRRLAGNTLNLLPKETPIVEIDTKRAGPSSAVSALVHGLSLVSSAGRAAGIDPGRPGVPEFGRKLYNLKAFHKPSYAKHALTANQAAAIERKARNSVDTLASLGLLEA